MDRVKLLEYIEKSKFKSFKKTIHNGKLHWGCGCDPGNGTVGGKLRSVYEMVTAFLHLEYGVV